MRCEGEAESEAKAVVEEPVTREQPGGSEAEGEKED